MIHNILCISTWIQTAMTFVGKILRCSESYNKGAILLRLIKLGCHDSCERATGSINLLSTCYSWNCILHLYNIRHFRIRGTQIDSAQRENISDVKLLGCSVGPRSDCCLLTTKNKTFHSVEIAFSWQSLRLINCGVHGLIGKMWPYKSHSQNSQKKDGFDSDRVK